jgi:hypothetical protein
MCGGRGVRAGLLTLFADQWAPPLTATNGRRDTIEACIACAMDWKAVRPGTTVFRPLPPPLEALN